MAWTYSDPSTSDRDAVRFLVGDTDTTDQRVTDEEIAFALSQASDDVYLAAAICARALAGKYANLVDTKFESVSSNYSDLRDNYTRLATQLERQSKKFAANGLGIPAAGGMSISEIDSVESDTDRVPSKFRRDQYANPPRGGLEEGFGWV